MSTVTRPPHQTTSHLDGKPHNAGNDTDTFQLAVESVNGEAQIDITAVTLEAGQSAPITVTITAPMDAPGGETITTTVTATSAVDPALSASVVTGSWIYWRLFLPLIGAGN